DKHPDFIHSINYVKSEVRQASLNSPLSLVASGRSDEIGVIPRKPNIPHSHFKQTVYIIEIALHYCAAFYSYHSAYFAFIHNPYYIIVWLSVFDILREISFKSFEYVYLPKHKIIGTS